METVAAVDEVKEAIKKDILDAKLKRAKKELPTGFASSAESMSTADLEKVINDCAVQTVQLDNKLDTDENLMALEEQAKDLRGAYRDTRKVLTAKIKWCVHLLESRGAR